MVGDGWWCGFVGFDPRRGGKLYGDRPALIAELHLAFPDGTRQRVVTDDRWRESPGPLWYSDLLMGEYRDGLAELGEWDQPRRVRLAAVRPAVRRHLHQRVRHAADLPVPQPADHEGPGRRRTEGLMGRWSQ